MWSLIRTILIVLNVLGAIAFVAVAGMDYGRRQTWSYAVLLHDVAINGLPLDKDEKTGNEEKTAELLGEAGVKQVFEGQSNPVSTQLEEVARFKKQFDDTIAAKPDKPYQLLTLSRILSPLSTTESQREQYVSVQTYLVDAKMTDALKADLARVAAAAKGDKKPFEAAFADQAEALPGVSRRPFVEAYLVEQKKSPAKKPEELFDDAIEQMRQDYQAKYNAAFDAALANHITPNGSTPQERKAYVASLLFNLTAPMSEASTGTVFAPGTPFDIATGPYRHFLTVVGLAAGVDAIARQGRVLAHMSDELQLQTERDRSIFVAEHQQLVNQLQQAATQQAALEDALARQRELLAKRQALVNHRKQDIVKYEADLARLGEETAQRLSEIRAMNEELYKTRVATRNATEANQRFEQKIRTLEKDR